MPASIRQMSRLGRSLLAPHLKVPRQLERQMLELDGEHLRGGSQRPDLDPERITFYNMRFCMYAHRTALVLLAKQINFQTVNIFLRDKPEWFLKLTPLAKVPALQIHPEGAIIFESLICNEYLEEKFPDKPLARKTPEQRARDREVVELSKKNKDAHVDMLEEAFRGLELLEQELLERGTSFFYGDEKPGLIDYNLWPWFERLEAFAHRIDFPRERFPELSRWIGQMSQDLPVQLYRLSSGDHLEFLRGLVAGEANYNLIWEKKVKASQKL